MSTDNAVNASINVNRVYARTLKLWNIAQYQPGSASRINSPSTRLSLRSLLRPTIIACFLTSRVPRFPIFDDKVPHPHPRAG